MIKISDITVDNELQSRMALSEEKIAEYAEMMEDGVEFAPIQIVDDGKKFYMWDGFHRYHAAVKAGRTTIEATIKKGTYRNAFIWSLGANSNHGLPVSNADKRLKVSRALNDIEISLWSDQEIAKTCGVTRVMVYKMRKERFGPSAPSAPSAPKAPKETAKPAAKPEAVGEHDDYDEREDVIKDLAAEVENLKGQLAVGALPEEQRQEAASYLDQLKTENEQLRQQLDAVTLSRDQFMAENAQLKKQVAMLQKKLKAQP